MRPRRGLYRWRSAISSFLLVAVIAVFPLLVALAAAPSPRSVIVELGAGLGLLGLGLMVVQACTTGRPAWLAPSFGSDNLLHFHRHLGLLGSILILAHPVTLLAAEPDFLRYLDPRADWLRALSLWGLIGLLVVIVVSSLWRQRLGLSYEHWRLVHGSLALLLLVMGLGHALMVGHYLHAFWQQAAIVAWVGLGLALILLSRVLRPWLSRRRPWELVSVTAERGDCWTLSFRPLGHSGLRFEPGQYGWFTLGDTPWTLQQHPFSFACSAGSRELCITAAVSGDFTATLPEVKPGTRAWIEGPMGSFVPDPDPNVALFMVAGGIGITPMMSQLRTFRERGEQRSVLLIYANPTLEEVTFFEELNELQAVLDLRVIHVLENPPDDWSGESGLVDPELIGRYLDGFDQPAQYLTCGPEPLMDLVESSLRKRGVDWRRVFSERFEIV